MVLGNPDFISQKFYRRDLHEPENQIEHGQKQNEDHCAGQRFRVCSRDPESSHGSAETHRKDADSALSKCFEVAGLIGKGRGTHDQGDDPDGKLGKHGSSRHRPHINLALNLPGRGRTIDQAVPARDGAARNRDEQERP